MCLNNLNYISTRIKSEKQRLSVRKKYLSKGVILMKKLYYLIILTVILGLVLTGCSLLSNISQVPTTEQSGITYLTKALPLHDNLVGLWHFSGNVDDTSGKGNDGTVNGDPIYVDNPPMGQALSFGGSNDYVSVGNIGVTGDWTVEFWAKLASTDKTIYYPIGLSPASSSSWGSGIFLAYIGDKWGVYDGVNIVWGSSVISTNTWYNFAVTKSGTTYTLYLDGEYENTGNLADIDITNLNIGRRSDEYWYFEGTIDEVRIWNVALSPGQLGFIYDFRGILPPINKDGSSVFKLGRTIPVKFQLLDDQDNFVTDAVANIFVKKVSNGTSGEVAAVSTAAATTGNLFRYDSSSNQYIFNLSTKLPLNGVNWSTGTWEIRIELDDGMSYNVQIGLR
jgi:hypothetical protein